MPWKQLLRLSISAQRPSSVKISGHDPRLERTDELMMPGNIVGLVAQIASRSSVCCGISTTARAGKAFHSRSSHHPHLQGCIPSFLPFSLPSSRFLASHPHPPLKKEVGYIYDHVLAYPKLVLMRVSDGLKLGGVNIAGFDFGFVIISLLDMNIN